MYQTMIGTVCYTFFLFSLIIQITHQRVDFSNKKQVSNQHSHNLNHLRIKSRITPSPLCNKAIYNQYLPSEYYIPCHGFQYPWFYRSMLVYIQLQKRKYYNVYSSSSGYVVHIWLLDLQTVSFTTTHQWRTDLHVLNRIFALLVPTLPLNCFDLKILVVETLGCVCYIKCFFSLIRFSAKQLVDLLVELRVN